MNIFKKKFKEEFVDYPIEDGSLAIKEKNKTPINNKTFKFNLNNDEEVISTLDFKKQNKEINAHSIQDLRFLQVQTFTTQTLIYVHHENPNKNLIKLFNEVGLLVSLGVDNKSNVSENENLSKFEENVKNIEIGIEKTIKMFDSENMKNLRKQLLILYIDLEVSDIQVFLILSLMYKLTKRDINLMIFTDYSILIPLNLGMNKIYFPNILFTKKGVGLLPMEKSVISTKGLRWDVTSWETNFGHANLSTSNEFEGDEICIYVESGCVIFTAEIDSDMVPFI